MRFVQADVFTTTPLEGNPLAVVFEAEGLDGTTMQKVAREMNLSETVFVLPPGDGADYRVRIFTPNRELGFAGHPTIGTAHVMRERGLVASSGRVVQECGAGLVPLDLEADGTVWLSSPPVVIDPYDEAMVEGWLGAPVRACARVDVGVAWVTAEVDDVRGLHPDLGAMDHDVTVWSKGDGDAWVRVRSFAPQAGIAEDPVCGSGNLCVAAMLRQADSLPPDGRYTASQGTECGRPGRLELQVTPDEIRLGGRSVTVLEGDLRL